MQIAQALSGYTLGEADLLRRAMGKKIKAEMDAQRARFVEGAVERGVARADAVMIFDLVREVRRATASTSRTPPPTRWSPTRPPI